MLSYGNPSFKSNGAMVEVHKAVEDMPKLLHEVQAENWIKDMEMQIDIS